MLFLGTTVTGGKGRALIVATGRGTELGRIATLMTSVPVEPTPLQRRVGAVGRVLAPVSLRGAAVLVLLGVCGGWAALCTVFSGGWCGCGGRPGWVLPALSGGG